MWPCALSRPLLHHVGQASQWLPCKRIDRCLPHARLIWTGTSREQLVRIASAPAPEHVSDFARVEPVLAEIRQLIRLEADRNELQGQRNAETDKDLLELYDSEIAGATDRLAVAANYLEELLLASAECTNGEDLDDNDAVLEVQPGVGGQEASLFASEIWRMYERHSERHGWAFEVESFRESEFGGVQEAIAIVRGSGEGAFGSLRRESGVHRVQRIPITEKKGRMQTSSAVVVVLPMAGESDVDIPVSDIRIDISKKSSGPGGQSVNAAHQAVRITHLPTGMSVLSNQSQSQFENRKRALDLLKARIFSKARNEKVTKERDERQRQRGTGDRSEKIRTYNFARDEVVDHRLDKKLGLCSVQGVMFEDQFDELVHAFKDQERAARLQSAVETLRARLMP